MNLFFPDSIIRILLIFWQNPTNINTSLTEILFFKLLFLLSTLPSYQYQKFFLALEKYPTHIFAARILKPLQEHLSFNILTG